ncbi:MAG: alpha-amylase [Chloroflexi bacterium]|nr:alpha-amylase [Chloroflexota bacterium]
MSHWANDAIFYHIYPLGLCGAPQRNDFTSPPVPRLEQVYSWLDHIQYLGANTLYLGPLFESGSHGYDTRDYYTVDRRLGDRQTLSRLSAELHRRGIRLILDAVFNHTGRDFWAFQDILARGPDSPYCGWYQDLRFDGRSPYGDPFTYQGWNGHYNLAKLNLSHPDVQAHLLQATALWMDEFDVDGLRLDAADCIDPSFLRQLASFCRTRRPDFWLVGEVVHGDYRKWANPQTLDSVTNYECYKGQYSSLVDRNYFEINYSLNRQFGPEGIYRGLPLYQFVDNHDVNRVASMLADPAGLYPLYGLLFSMPGVPSIYYGSEWGIEGRKNGDDSPLRPALTLEGMNAHNPHPDLPAVLHRLAQVRQALPALRYGEYLPLAVASQQLAFARRGGGATVVVALNAADQAVSIDLPLTGLTGKRLEDQLNPGHTFPVQDGHARVTLDPHWARIMSLQA